MICILKNLKKSRKMSKNCRIFWIGRKERRIIERSNMNEEISNNWRRTLESHSNHKKRGYYTRERLVKIVCIHNIKL